MLGVAVAVARPGTEIIISATVSSQIKLSPNTPPDSSLPGLGWVSGILWGAKMGFGRSRSMVEVEVEVSIPGPAASKQLSHDNNILGRSWKVNLIRNIIWGKILRFILVKRFMVKRVGKK